MQNIPHTKPWSREVIIAIGALVFAVLLMIPALLPWIWLAALALAVCAGVAGIRKTKSGKYRGRPLAIAIVSLIALVAMILLFVGFGGMRLF